MAALQVVQLSERAHLLPGGVNVVLVVEGGRAVAIDSGQGKEGAKRVRRALAWLGVELTALLTTHAHADHFGGHAELLRQRRVPVFAPPLEAELMRAPRLEPIYLAHGAEPPPELLGPWLMAEASPVDGSLLPGPWTFEGLTLRILDVAGHAHQQVAIEVDDVLLAADAGTLNVPAPQPHHRPGPPGRPALRRARHPRAAGPPAAVAAHVTGAAPGPVSGWTLRSAGGCEGVTGSAHLLSDGGRHVLVDAGMFQSADAAAANAAAWPFDPRSVDAVVLSHGHLDHVGRLPKLVADGFRGPVYATPATLAVAEVVLRDAARVMAEDADRAQRRLRRAGRDPGRARALYREADVERALALARPVEFHDEVDLGRGVRFRLGRAGHVLGAAWVVLDGASGRVLASGDLGDVDGALHPPPEAPPRADAVLIEATYGDRRHRGAAATTAEFAEVVARTLGRGGNVLVPTFALERTQSVLHALQVLERNGAIPAAPVVLDAPMGDRMTDLYRRHPGTLRPELSERLAAGDDPFRPAGLSVARTGRESRALNEAKGVVIVAGAGMMTGGRILHHLKHHLWDERSSLVVVGYQAEGTLGRQLVDGARRVRVLGETIAVAAEVHTINGFSAHADAPALDAWWTASAARVVVPVHGEVGPRAALAQRATAAGRLARSATLGVDLPL